jgi:hypothetical protein
LSSSFCKPGARTFGPLSDEVSSRNSFAESAHWISKLNNQRD